jgi:hypothetical protein
LLWRETSSLNASGSKGQEILSCSQRLPLTVTLVIPAQPRWIHSTLSKISIEKIYITKKRIRRISPRVSGAISAATRAFLEIWHFFERSEPGAKSFRRRFPAPIWKICFKTRISNRILTVM